MATAADLRCGQTIHVGGVKSLLDGRGRKTEGRLTNKEFQVVLEDSQIAWQLTDQLVRQAQEVFHSVWQESSGNDGYVSFELDPLLEDPALAPPHPQRVQKDLQLGGLWAADHENRMIKVPATPGGLASLEELVASGVTINVTLIFTAPQHALLELIRQRRDQRSAV